MEWYWWALIVVALVALAIIKVKVAGKFLANMKHKQEEKQRRMEEDE